MSRRGQLPLKGYAHRARAGRAERRQRSISTPLRVGQRQSNVVLVNGASKLPL